MEKIKNAAAQPPFNNSAHAVGHDASGVKIGNIRVGKKPVLFCTVLEPSTVDAAHFAEQAAYAGATCIELRLDKLMSVSEVQETVSRIRFPKLAVCRPLKYDGAFKGTEKERAEWLIAAIASGADAVDVEAIMAPKLRNKVIKTAREKGIPVVICYENFSETPSQKRLLRILKQEEAWGADIAKCAVMANSSEDLLVVLQTVIQAKKVLKIPFIAIAMGEKGKPSRILGPVLGSAGTYCCLPGKSGAPGQMTVEETSRMIEALSTQ